MRSLLVQGIDSLSVTKLRKHLVPLTGSSRLNAVLPWFVVRIRLQLDRPLLLLRLDSCPAEFAQVIGFDLTRHLRVLSKELQVRKCYAGYSLTFTPIS